MVCPGPIVMAKGAMITARGIGAVLMVMIIGIPIQPMKHVVSVMEEIGVKAASETLKCMTR